MDRKFSGTDSHNLSNLCVCVCASSQGAHLSIILKEITVLKRCIVSMILNSYTVSMILSRYIVIYIPVGISVEPQKRTRGLWLECGYHLE